MNLRIQQKADENRCAVSMDVDLSVVDTHTPFCRLVSIALYAAVLAIYVYNFRVNCYVNFEFNKACQWSNRGMLLLARSLSLCLALHRIFIGDSC